MTMPGIRIWNRFMTMPGIRFWNWFRPVPGPGPKTLKLVQLVPGSVLKVLDSAGP